MSSATLRRPTVSPVPNLTALRPILLALATPLVLLALWQIACLARLAPPYLLPSPADVLARLDSELIGGTFWQDVWASLSRALTGFVLGSAAGLALGLLLGLSRMPND